MNCWGNGHGQGLSQSWTQAHHHGHDQIHGDYQNKGTIHISWRIRLRSIWGQGQIWGRDQAQPTGIKVMQNSRLRLKGGSRLN